MWIRQPTLALKPRGDVTRNLKQATSGPKLGHMCPPKNFKKKKFCFELSGIRINCIIQTWTNSKLATDIWEKFELSNNLSVFELDLIATNL